VTCHSGRVRRDLTRTRDFGFNASHHPGMTLNLKTTPAMPDKISGGRHELVRHDRKSGRHHRLDAGHRPRHCRADGRARRKGRHLLAQGRRLRRGDEGDQRRIRQGNGCGGGGQHLQQGEPSKSGRREQPDLRQDRRAGLQCRVEPVLRSARQNFRRSVPENPRQQYRRQQLADLDGGAADDRTQGRRDHHRLLDRWIEGLDHSRRLRDLEGGRHAARAQSRVRVRQAQYPRELHRARPDQDRFREGLVGQSGESEGLDLALAAATHRPSRRDCRGRRVHGIEGRRLHDLRVTRPPRKRDCVQACACIRAGRGPAT